MSGKSAKTGDLLSPSSCVNVQKALILELSKGLLSFAPDTASGLIAPCRALAMHRWRPSGGARLNIFGSAQ
jgi:hypothetical protein